jgi:hypothetical protein
MSGISGTSTITGGGGSKGGGLVLQPERTMNIPITLKIRAELKKENFILYYRQIL